ncbi:histidine phosphotransferase family protein [Roseicyclus sp. F158]|uniref:Histidine phosphotransferase family protein n=1 Tax=Tropicimonas omnivorans TaxID=3075590 RepID=A0ABU3DJN2_9RHOB|nr:histidine phosphotransferase family protein [Roseicyclus sp. F158]MDT0683929.1 histidine phosphotransferase family protein [Roseicyclus sp. F158]
MSDANPEATLLAGLIGSRLCHDLISPVGAIANGMELFTMENEATSEIDLITASVASAEARLRFFRIAFGRTHGGGPALGAGEAAAILGGMWNGGRFCVRWQIRDPLPRPMARLVFLMLLCVETAFPVGGTATVEATKSGYRLSATGKRLAMEPETWSILGGAPMPPELGADRVQFPMAAAALAETRREAKTEATDTSLTILI